MLLNGQVINPGSAQYVDGSQPLLNVGRQGDLLVTEFHGKRYYKAARGKLFWATFGAAGAGVSVLAPGQTAMTGAMIYNPVGSGVYVELEQIRVTCPTVATDVVAGLMFEGSVQVPSAVTNADQINALPLGGTSAAPLAKTYKAATIVAMTLVGGLGINIQATTSPPVNAVLDFDGSLVIAPGFALNLISSITQSTNKLQIDYIWSEHLP